MSFGSKVKLVKQHVKRGAKSMLPGVFKTSRRRLYEEVSDSSSEEETSARPGSARKKKSSAAPSSRPDVSSSESEDDPDFPSLPPDDHPDPAFISSATQRYNARMQTLQALDDEEYESANFVGPSKATKRVWKASFHPSEAPAYFDSLLNDFNKKRDETGDAVIQDWYDQPLDRPRCIHCRPSYFKWAKTFSEASQIKAASQNRLVYRAEYICAGTHRLKPIGAVDESSTSEESSDEESSEDDSSDEESSDGESPEGCDGCSSSGADPKPVQRRGWSCKGRKHGNVKLQFEVSARDLNKMHVYQIGRHRDANPKTQPLRPSHRLRHVILGHIKNYGTRPTTIFKHVAQTFPLGEGSREYGFPEFRRYTLPQVQNMFSNARQREKLAENAFEGITILAERNPDKLFCYSPLDKAQKSKFHVGLKTDHSVDTTILNYRPRGLYVDSSWRHKNENRAACTNIVVVDEAFHFSPAAVLVSANTKESTLETFFRSFEYVVQERAAVLKEDITKSTYTTDTERAALLREAEFIVENGFSPRKISADKDRPQFNAIKKVWPKGRHRLCQFHVMQALTRRVTDSKGRKKTIKIAMTRGQLDAMRSAFRAFQRIKKRSDLPAFREAFLQKLQDIFANPPDESADAGVGENEDDEDDEDEDEVIWEDPDAIKKYEIMKKYFDDNWFDPYWLDHFTDIGLADEDLRDGGSNTSNYVEASWKHFDEVVLEQKKNKRIDRLLLLILNEFFPYFEQVRPNYLDTQAVVPIDKKYIDITRRAYVIWEEGMVQFVRDSRYTVSIEKTNSSGKTKTKVYRIKLDMAHCSCTGFDEGGKLCVHIQAARLLRTSGPAGEWIRRESIRDQGRRNKQRRLEVPPVVRGKKNGKKKKKRKQRAATDRVTDRETYRAIIMLQQDNQRRLEAQEGERLQEHFWESNNKGLAYAHQTAGERTPEDESDVDTGDDQSVINVDKKSSAGRPAPTEPLHANRGSKRKARNGSDSDVEIDTSPRAIKRTKTTPPKSKKKSKKNQTPVDKKPKKKGPMLFQNPSYSKRSGRSAAAGADAEEEAEEVASPSTRSRAKDPVKVVTVTKWEGDSEKISLVDVDVHVDMFNALSTTLATRILFLRSPGSDLIDEVNRQWAEIRAPDATPEEEAYPENARLRYVHHGRVGTYDTIIFVHQDPTTQSWSLLEYNVKAPRAQAVFAVNPVNSNLKANVHDLCRTAEFFRKDRDLDNVKKHSTTRYSTERVPLQVGSKGSSFWTLYLALARVFNVPLAVDHLNLGDLVAIKKRLHRLHGSFISSPSGLCRWELDDALEGMDANHIKEIWKAKDGRSKLSADDIVAPRSQEYPHLSERANAIAEAESTLAKLTRTVHKSMSNSVEVFDTDVSKTSLNEARRGIALQRELLGVAIQDLKQDPCQHAKISPRRIFVVPVRATGLMAQAATTAVSVLPLANSHVSQEFWVPETDIFDLETLVLPFSFPQPSNKREMLWTVVVVDMIGGVITVLMPTFEVRMHNALVKRTKLMLEFERKARKPKQKVTYECLWSKGDKPVAMQATHTSDEPFLIFGYVKELLACPSSIPSDPTYHPSSYQIRHLRVELLARVSRHIQPDLSDRLSALLLTSAAASNAKRPSKPIQAPAGPPPEDPSPSAGPSKPRAAVERTPDPQVDNKPPTRPATPPPPPPPPLQITPSSSSSAPPGSPPRSSPEPAAMAFGPELPSPQPVTSNPSPAVDPSIPANHFSSTQDNEAQRILRDVVSKHDLRDVVLKVGYPGREKAEDVTGKSLNRLIMQGAWVGDEAMNAWVMCQNGDLDDPSMPEPCRLSMTSFFFTKLVQKGYKKGNLHKWFKNIHIFEPGFERLVVPINENSNHWIVACINLREKRIEVYDSFPSQKDRMDVHKHLMGFLESHHRHQRQDNPDIAAFNEAEWAPQPFMPSAYPIQHGNNDCGVFAAASIQHLCKTGSHLTDTVFRQANVLAFRIDVGWHLYALSKRLQKSKPPATTPAESESELELENSEDELSGDSTSSEPSESKKKGNKKKAQAPQKKSAPKRKSKRPSDSDDEEVGPPAKKPRKSRKSTKSKKPTKPSKRKAVAVDDSDSASGGETEPEAPSRGRTRSARKTRGSSQSDADTDMDAHTPDPGKDSTSGPRALVPAKKFGKDYSWGKANPKPRRSSPA